MQVSVDSMKSSLTRLTSYHTRHSKSGYVNEVAEWLKNEFKNIGYDNISFHDYREGIDGDNLHLKKCNL